MYYSEMIKIPNETKGRIVRRQRKTCVQIMYEYDHNYDPVRKFTVPRRSIIGKTDSKLSDKMYPNDNYYKYFGVQNQKTPPENIVYRSSALKIGSICVLEKIMNECKISNILSDIIVSDHGFDLSGLFKDLIMYFIITERNVASYYPAYAYNHPLFSDNMHIYSDSSVCRFFQKINDNKRIEFLEQWNKNRSKEDRCYISYDSTNKNIQAGDISFAEWGHAKIDKGTKIFNLSIGYDTTNSIPLLYELYPGSITDTVQLPFFLDKLKSYGYNNLGIILDRGYFSEENIRQIEEEYNYNFLIMLKGKEKIIKNLILNNSIRFERNEAYYIPEYDVYGIMLKSKIFKQDEEDRNIFIYYSIEKFSKENDKLRQTISNAEKIINDFINHPERNVGLELGPEITNYYDITYNSKGGILYATKNLDKITDAVNTCGYFALVSSEDITARDALILYKGRDASEKLFNQDKTALGSNCERIHSDQALKSKIFVEFVALIIRNRMYTLLQTQKIKDGQTCQYYDVPDAIAELEKIEMERQGDGTYRLSNAITRKQKNIISCFGMNEDDIWNKSFEISNILKDSKNNENIEDIEDEE